MKFLKICGKDLRLFSALCDFFPKIFGWMVLYSKHFWLRDCFVKLEDVLLGFGTMRLFWWKIRHNFQKWVFWCFELDATFLAKISCLINGNPLTSMKAFAWKKRSQLKILFSALYFFLERENFWKSWNFCWFQLGKRFTCRMGIPSSILVL